MGFDPVYIVKGYYDKVTIESRDGSVETIPTDEPLDVIKDLVHKTNDQTYRYLGDAVGIINYDAIRFWEKIPKNHNSKGVLKSLDQINDNDLILDMGEKTLQNIFKVIDESKTILWNGPAGYFEIDEFSIGSKKIANKISENTKTKSLVSIAGGGDTVAAINKFKCSNGFTYLSTAGGAFLELLEGKALPGIKALEINE